MKITIILGAGSSKAYEKWSYPMLNELLSQMLCFANQSYVEKFPNGDARREYFLPYQGKQRLYLAYSLMKVFGLKQKNLEKKDVAQAFIDKQFALIVEKVIKEGLDLGVAFKILRRLEKTDYESVTRAHWALSHAITYYMLQMGTEVNEKNVTTKIDCAHRKLINLIDDMLNLGYEVSVVDFNYDCILEQEWNDLGDNRKFGWNICRKRNVLEDSFDPMSVLAKANRFQAPWDGDDWAKKVNLIKPHGDMCTFLRGTTNVYYRGGRHSKMGSAIFPLALSDVKDDDIFVRSSIMPPTDSKLRHKSDFYELECLRIKKDLTESKIFVLIGWSARGSDHFYRRKIFQPAFQNRSHSPQLYVITKSSTKKEFVDLQNNLGKLFGDKMKLRNMQICGFNEAAVEKLGRLILS